MDKYNVVVSVKSSTTFSMEEQIAICEFLNSEGYNEEIDYVLSHIAWGGMEMQCDPESEHKHIVQHIETIVEESVPTVETKWYLCEREPDKTFKTECSNA